MITYSTSAAWEQFLGHVKSRASKTEFDNWFTSIEHAPSENNERTLLVVPNIFVQDYLLANYPKELILFFGADSTGKPTVDFVIKKKPTLDTLTVETPAHLEEPESEEESVRLNPYYLFDNFIEGPSNQFVKSAALGVAMRPGKSYNPLFIHGGVGLGKTHLLHAIGHYVKTHHKRLRVQCITTEGFINELVAHLKNKSIDKMKRFYRSLDVLLVDDIQFLQNRLNFEEEFCNTFESLINQSKQIVITSDKPPSELKLSERLVARMEWGLVANVGVPDLETRVAIIQSKAEEKGLKIDSKVAFFIAERIFNNVRQIEGALNRLSAYCRIMHLEVTEEVVEKTLFELFTKSPTARISVETILKSVATIFDVRISDLKGNSREQSLAFARQVAMYLAKELVNEPIVKIAASFGGKTHSTLLHSWKKITHLLESDETLQRQIQMARRELGV